MTDQRLLDDLAVRNLASAYSHAVMRRDGQAAGAVYAPDGVLSAFYQPDIVGRDAVSKVLSDVLEGIDFIIQTCAAGVVDIDGDSARATWSVTEWVRHKGKEGLSCCFGTYEDELVRLSEGWRFKRRRFVPFYRGSVPSTGKLYRPPEFSQDYAPWPFLGVGG